MSKNNFKIGNKELEMILLQILNKPDGYLTEDDLSAVESLELPEGIKSLYGINYLKNLKSIGIKDVYSCIDDLHLISELKKLESFGMYYDYFNPPPRQNISIEFLRGMTSINSFGASGVCLPDLSPLSSLPNLKKAWMPNSCVKDISALEPLKKLEELVIWNGGTSDLSPLSEHTELRRIDISDNNIDSLSPLNNCKKLTSLTSHCNCYDDISPLADKIELEILGIEYNKVIDITPVKNLLNLKYLKLSRNSGIKDFSILKHFKQPINIWLEGIEIPDNIKNELRAALPECEFKF